MESAVVNKNKEDLFKAAHTMKTNNSMVGAIRMTEICIELETQGRSGILDNSEESFAELTQKFSYVKTKLEQILEEKADQRLKSGIPDIL